MWKRDEEQPLKPLAPQAASTDAARVPAARSGRATIGPSIVIKGEVSGSEDLLIQGRVDGSVVLALHAVTVGSGGRVKADIAGRVITVEGDVEGDLNAEEQIVLRGSAKVEGDLRAPRVVLEDGASFRGMVDMGPRRAPEGDASRAGHERSVAASSAGATDAGAKPSAGTSVPKGVPAAASSGGKGAQERKTGT